AITNGWPVTIHLLNALLSRVHSSDKIPSFTRTPAFRSLTIPVPECFGLGSVAPMTTFLSPALIIASVHGAVRPVVEHGSRVTYSVASAGIGAPPPRKQSIS